MNTYGRMAVQLAARYDRIRPKVVAPKVGGRLRRSVVVVGCAGRLWLSVAPVGYEGWHHAQPAILGGNI